MTTHRRVATRPHPLAGVRKVAWTSVAHRLRRRRWLLVAAVVPTIVAALVVSAMRDDRYRAEVVVNVMPDVVDDLLAPTLPADTGDESPASITDEVVYLRGTEIRADVVQALGIDEVPRPDIGLVGERSIRIRVDADTPELATLVADTYADIYVTSRWAARSQTIIAAAERLQQSITTLEQQIATLDTEDATAAEQAEQRAVEAERDVLVDVLERLRLVEAAAEPAVEIVSGTDRAVSLRGPSTFTVLLAALAAGAVLGLIAVAVVEVVDDTVRDTADVRRADPTLKVFGLVPEDPSVWRAAPIRRSRDPASVAYRVIANQVLGRARPTKVVQVASTAAGDGATTTAAGLAVVLAERGVKVAVVDLDLREPQLHRAFGVDGSLGVVEVLGGESLELALLPLHPHLQLLCAGTRPEDPSIVFSDGGPQRLIERLREQFDIVVVDSPPVSVADDAAVLVGSVDVLLLVAGAGRTTVASLRRSLQHLGDLGVAPDGLVLNRAVLRRSIGRRQVEPSRR